MREHDSRKRESPGNIIIEQSDYVRNWETFLDFCFKFSNLFGKPSHSHFIPFA
jgi:hypothetical protein